MNETVSWLIELSVKPGMLERLRELTDEMVHSTKTEPGALTYERFVSEDGRVVHLYERYSDSAAAVTHLETFAELYAARFLELVVRERVLVYGPASQELRELMGPMGPAYLRLMAGFDR